MLLERSEGVAPLKMGLKIQKPKKYRKPFVLKKKEKNQGNMSVNCTN